MAANGIATSKTIAQIVMFLTTFVLVLSIHIAGTNMAVIVVVAAVVIAVVVVKMVSLILAKRLSAASAALLYLCRSSLLCLFSPCFVVWEICVLHLL